MSLAHMVWWFATLHIAGGLKLDDHCGPFQLRPFYDSVIHIFLASECLDKIYERQDNVEQHFFHIVHIVADI